MNIGGVNDLLASERGVFSLLAVIAITVLVIFGKIDGQTWVDFMKYLAGALIMSKTVTAAVRTYKGTNPPSTEAPQARVVSDETT